jgi:hypothetical protein
MTIRQTFFLVLLTSIYLCFELAFNGRLLDVVGSAESAEQIHFIEKYGRMLSGIAVALVVLQILLAWRNRAGGSGPSVQGILISCSLTGVIVFFTLQFLVDILVARSTPEFRRASLNIVLVQRALVSGNVELDGLGGEQGLFSQPPGKAFLALFPLMAVSVKDLDDKIRDVKLELIERELRQKNGGAAGYYQHYVEAVKKTNEQWQRYQRIPSPKDVEKEVAQRQDRAWNEYLQDLGRRGWTPSTIPPAARSVVQRRVRAKISVSPSWSPDDEASFRGAVAQQVRRRMSNLNGAEGGLKLRGQFIPSGLGWLAFFSHPAVQAELRDSLKLPGGAVLQTTYATGTEFERLVFLPMVRDLARRKLLRYDAAADTYADGARNASYGLDAARAAIVPPIALLFSLLGAIGHFAKLGYLLLRLVVASRPTWRAQARALWLAPVGIVLLTWSGLTLSSNHVVESRVYSFIRQQVLSSNGIGGPPLMNALHVVAVGQAYAYPVNEWIRKNLLGGITYGYIDSPR